MVEILAIKGGMEMSDLERAALFGATAILKSKAGEPTTDAEDKIILGSMGYRVMRAVEIHRAAERELVAA
jgi:hypothetical protein